jgi:hypothetical protein
MFIKNFQDTYERPSTAEILKSIRQKHDESLQNYVKHFCNARNTITYIQDIEIINTFRDGVSDIKTVEEIAMKKPKTVADLLAVAKTLINNDASLNLIMKKTFINMGLNLKDLTPVHDMFHGIIPGQSSTPVGCIDLEVSCGTGDNKRKEVLTFEVASFDIGYNNILGRPFLLKFMAIIHTTYATLKMPDPKGVITINADQRDTLACENTTLTHVGWFGEKAAQEQSAKIAKTHDGSTSFKSPAPNPSTIDSPRLSATKKGAYGASASSQQLADQSVDLKEEVDDKEVLINPSNPNKKPWISTGLDAK